MSAHDSFIDTNILIYSVDTVDEAKHNKAQALVAELISTGRAVISTQVLQEFYNVATKKLNIQKEKVLNIIESLTSIKIVNTTPYIILCAIRLSIFNKLSIWDSLVLAAANFAECSFFYSEDLNNGQVIESVKIVNPFL